MDDIVTKMHEDIIAQIKQAKYLADINHIKANMIIIDTGVAVTNHLIIDDSIYPPMIFGLEVTYMNNLAKDLGANFVICDGNTSQKEITRLRQENAELRDKLERIYSFIGMGKELIE